MANRNSQGLRWLARHAPVLRPTPNGPMRQMADRQASTARLSKEGTDFGPETSGSPAVARSAQRPAAKIQRSRPRALRVISRRRRAISPSGGSVRRPYTSRAWRSNATPPKALSSNHVWRSLSARHRSPRASRDCTMKNQPSTAPAPSAISSSTRKNRKQRKAEAARSRKTSGRNREVGVTDDQDRRTRVTPDAKWPDAPDGRPAGGPKQAVEGAHRSGAQAAGSPADARRLRASGSSRPTITATTASGSRVFHFAAGMFFMSSQAFVTPPAHALR